MTSQKVLEEIAAERQRQVEVEGWTPEHDDHHHTGELALAAADYAFRSARPHPRPTMYWPFDVKWFKPGTRRQALVKAAALIVAEIERIDRAGAR